MENEELRKVNQGLVYGIRLCVAAREMIKESGVMSEDIMDIEREIREAASIVQKLLKK